MTGSVIPGDLPFQFGKATDGSVIDMPGTIITRQGDGSFVVTFGGNAVIRSFPPPTGEFAKLSAEKLKVRLRTSAENLREFHRQYFNEFMSFARNSDGNVPDGISGEFSKRYRSEYYNKHLDGAMSLASEAMNRFPKDTPSVTFQHRGAQILYHRSFSGARPALDVAEFLDSLALQLPD
jgi:hypothetical protein